jgi:hypothetical protein
VVRVAIVGRCDGEGGAGSPPRGLLPSNNRDAGAQPLFTVIQI